MTESELDRANELKDKIRELDSFIRSAEMVWTGKLIKEKRRFIFKSAHFVFIESKELEMDTDLKNKVLQVLRDELEGLQEELNAI